MSCPFISQLIYQRKNDLIDELVSEMVKQLFFELYLLLGLEKGNVKYGEGVYGWTHYSYYIHYFIVNLSSKRTKKHYFVHSTIIIKLKVKSLGR